MTGTWKSETGFYHVVARGTGRQLIFESNDDRRELLGLVSESCSSNRIEIIAWCLMANHIHLVLNDSQDRISKALQGALSSYSRRFNRRSGRVGHLFESRFGRYPIEDEAYLLETVRYVHANPQNAGLCLLESYPWSSYSEYIRYFDEGVISGYSSPSIVANIFGSKNRFVDYSIRLSPSERIVSYMGEESDAERLCSAEKIAARHGTSLAVVKGLRRPERDPVLIDLSEAGFTAREIERFTGVSKSTVARIVNIYRSVVEETGTIDRTPGSNSIT